MDGNFTFSRKRRFFFSSYFSCTLTHSCSNAGSIFRAGEPRIYITYFRQQMSRSGFAGCALFSFRPYGEITMLTM